MINFTAVSTQALARLTTLRLWSHLATGRMQTVPCELEPNVHPAFHHAYRRFAQAYPAWADKGFNKDFLRHIVLPRLAQDQGMASSATLLPTAMELAWAWDRQFGPLVPTAVRVRQTAELIPIATCFLNLLEAELGKYKLR